MKLEPKDWIALVALVASVISLWWTWRRQTVEDRRWKALNAARVRLKEVKMKPWFEVSRDEAFTIDWGHEAKLVGGQLPTGHFRLPYAIVARSIEGMQLVPNWTPVHTVAMAEREARRLNLEPRALELCRQLRPEFTVVNMGKTDARDCTSAAWIRIDNGEWSKAHQSNATVTLSPDQESGFFFDVFLPLGTQFPAMLSFKVKLHALTEEGEELAQEIVASWDVASDSWFYGSGKTEPAVPTR
jgi:hypothetical protein